MFAIEITSNNMPKILEAHHTPNEDEFDYDLFMRYKNPWYIVTGYVNRYGYVKDFAILPAYEIENNYEHDPVKIKYDWDQIVRK